MKTKYLLGILFVTMFTASCNRTIDNKHRSLTIQTKGIEYDSLFIRNTEIPPFFIKGEKADSITWTFQIPDSLYKTTVSFEILPSLLTGRLYTMYGHHLFCFLVSALP